MMSSKGIRIEDERIEAINQWPEPQLVQNIQVFLGLRTFIDNSSRDSVR